MQDKKPQKDPLRIRFSRVYEDSSYPGFQYIEFNICKYQEGAYPQNNILSYQDKKILFRKKISDPSNLACMIKKNGAYVSSQSESFISCTEKSWQRALLMTWKYFHDFGMSYCQKSVYGLMINNGKLTVELLDSDGGLHPPRVIGRNGKPVEECVYVVPVKTLPDSFDIDDAENLTQYMM